MREFFLFSLYPLFALAAFAQNGAYVDLYSTKDFSTQMWSDGNTSYFKYQWEDEERQKSWCKRRTEPLRYQAQTTICG